MKSGLKRGLKNKNKYIKKWLTIQDLNNDSISKDANPERKTSYGSSL